MILQESIDEVLARVNVVDLISESVTLRKQGANYVGLCPFHSEKSPSFNVRETEGRFHCFGCAASGNAIHFLMKAKGMGFPEAVEELAQKCHLSLRYSTGSEKKPGVPTNTTNRIYQLNQAAQSFFERNLKEKKLPQASTAYSYLQERGFSDEAVSAFQLGLAPDAWRELSSFFLKSKVIESELLNCGLVKRNQQGEFYDVFRARLMFPIFTDAKRIAGFAGRSLPGKALTVPEDSPKYINSPETVVYRKSKILFGLPQALEAIRQSGEAFLVEGYLDVIGLWQAGVRQTVATCGTALTPEHVQKLSRICKRLYVLFDGDSAGQVAAGKVFPIFVNSGLDVKVIFLPQGKDPDEVAMQEGPQTLKWLKELPQQDLLDCYIEYLAKTLCGTSVKELGAAGKGKVSETLLKSLSQCKNAIEKSELVERAALRLKIESSTLREQLQSFTPSSEDGAASAPAQKSVAAVTVLPESKKEAAPAVKILNTQDLPLLDRDVLRVACLRRTQVNDEILQDPYLSQVLNSSTLQFIHGIAVICSQKMTINEEKQAFKSLLGEWGDSWRQIWKQAHEMQTKGDLDPVKCLQGCRQSAQKQQINQNLRLLEVAVSNCGDGLKKQELYIQKIELRRKLDQLR